MGFEEKVSQAAKMRDLINQALGSKLDAHKAMIVRSRFPFCSEADGSLYINLGGAWSSVGYLSTVEPEQIKLYEKVKQALIASEKFNVRDSSRSEYDLTHKLGLGNGASGWVTLR